MPLAMHFTNASGNAAGVAGTKMSVAASVAHLGVQATALQAVHPRRPRPASFERLQGAGPTRVTKDGHDFPVAGAGPGFWLRSIYHGAPGEDC